MILTSAASGGAGRAGLPALDFLYPVLFRVAEMLKEGFTRGEDVAMSVCCESRLRVNHLGFAVVPVQSLIGNRNRHTSRAVYG